jgi:hypothetical protein
MRHSALAMMLALVAAAPARAQGSTIAVTYSELAAPAGDEVDQSTDPALGMPDEFEWHGAGPMDPEIEAPGSDETIVVSTEAPPSEPEGAAAPVKTPTYYPEGFEPMRGLHLTAWVAGTRSLRRKFLAKASGTVVNAIIVPVKETDGRVYISGVESAKRFGTQRIAIPRPLEFLEDVRALGFKAVARVVVFEDNKLPRLKPEWAIRDRDGGIWENRKKLAWADPYRREVWEYNLEVAQRAIDLGFEEIQFDYIRFPSDGATERCRYSRQDHSSTTAVAVLLDFLSEAKRRFDPQGIPVSAAVFGLVTSAKDDLGIGQDIDEMAGVADALSPMMYPSHYAPGAYGLSNPNANPYKVIDAGLRDATRRLKRRAYKLRPYLQDFSLGYRYKEKEVRDQFAAAEKHGVTSWILWNPQNRYTWPALVPAAPSAAISPPGRADAIGGAAQGPVRPLQSPPVESVGVSTGEAGADRGLPPPRPGSD